MEQCLGAVFIVRWTAWPDNIGFWRVHCATTVACCAVARRKSEMKRSKIESQCLKRNAGQRREFRYGIKTRVRLPEQVFCVETRRRVSRKGASVLTSSSYGTWGEGTAKARKTPKAPKITARITAGAAGSSGSWARRSTHGFCTQGRESDFQLQNPSIMHATGGRRAGNSRPKRCRSVAKLSGFCNNVAATKFEIRIPKSETHEVAELIRSTSMKSPNFGLLATCVAGGRNAAAPGAQL